MRQRFMHFNFVILLFFFLSGCAGMQTEYDQLKQAHNEHIQRSSYTSDITDDDDVNDVTKDVDQNKDGVSGGDDEMMAEARLLRQHKGRLEARMRVLEEHNQQLDAQLKRLRSLLNSCHAVRHRRGRLAPNFNLQRCFNLFMAA